MQKISKDTKIDALMVGIDPSLAARDEEQN